MLQDLEELSEVVDAVALRVGVVEEQFPVDPVAFFEDGGGGGSLGGEVVRSPARETPQAAAICTMLAPRYPSAANVVKAAAMISARRRAPPSGKCVRAGSGPTVCLPASRLRG